MAANIFTLMGSIFVDNEEANKSIAKTSEEGEKSGGILAKLGGTALEVGKKFGEFALGVASAATGAAAALAGIAMQSSEAASRVNDTAQVLGISNEAFQEWDYILGLNGASIDSFGVGMKTLQQKMDDLSTGGKAATEFFTNLGVEFDTITNSTPEEAMELVIQKLQEMPEGAEKTALALDAFGKQGMALMPVLNMTAEETEKLKSTAHELSMVMSDDMIKAGDDFGDALDTAKGMISGVKNQIGAELLPAMTAGVEAFVAFATGAEDGADKLDGAIELMVDTIAEKIPAFLEKGGEIIMKLVEGVTTAVPKLVEATMPIIPDLVKIIIDLLPLVIQAGVDIIVSVVKGIADALPDLIPAVVEVIMTIVTALIDGLPDILDTALQLIIGLAEGLIKAIPVLIKKLPELIESIINFILGSIPQLIETGIALFIALVEALPEIITEIVKAIPEIIDSVITAVIDSIPLIVDAGIKLFVALIENLPQIIFLIVKEIPKIVTGIVNKVTELIPEMVSVGSDLIKGLWQGINDVKDWIFDKIGGFFGGIVDSVKNFFGIASPSKVFAGFGKNIGEGFIDGIKSMSSAINKTFDNVFNGFEIDDISANLNIQKNMPSLVGAGAYSGASQSRGTTQPGGVTNHFNINGLAVREEADIDRIARKLYNIEQREMRARGLS